MVPNRPKCLKCERCKYKKEFRKKNGTFHIICKECRKNFPEFEREFYGRNHFESDYQRHWGAICSILKAEFIRRKTINRKEVKNMAKVNSRAKNYAEKLTDMPNKMWFAVMTERLQMMKL
jgi:hypothetical protein